jgi:AcrR family transcriptional regulator
METRQKILNKALTLFNKKGIEYIGMRELAAALDMRIGNLTYYFPTKDDLVASISEEYSQENSRIHQQFRVISLYDFLAKNKLLFQYRIGYQCLLLSMVHLIERNPQIARRYEKVKSQRLSGLERDMDILTDNGYLNLGQEDRWLVVALNSLLGRFWMSEAALYVKRNDIKTQTNHYLKLLALFFKPYATKEGVEDIERFIEEISS